MSVSRLAFLVILGLLMVIPPPGGSIGKDRTMLDLGITFGTRTGVLFGVKYFVAENLGIGVDLFGITNPGPDFLVGVAVDAAYYPYFLGEYAYASAGFSYQFGFQPYRYVGARGVRRTHLLALNAGVGANTPTFWIPPAIESENKEDVPTVVYLELGAGRILWRRDSMEEAILGPDVRPGPQWLFPNIELGLRQGPFKPSWIE